MYALLVVLSATKITAPTGTVCIMVRHLGKHCAVLTEPAPPKAVSH
jgi:hypothetical protein